jgi:hypothetical protein
MTYDKLLREMSGEFLTTPLPEYWNGLPDNTLEHWVKENTYEPYENWDFKELIYQIESVTDVAWKHLKETNQCLS